MRTPSFQAATRGKACRLGLLLETRWRIGSVFLIALAGAALGSVRADGQVSVPLELYASNGSRWFEFASNAFAELGLRHFNAGDPSMTPTGPVPTESVPGTNDGFFLIRESFTDPEIGEPTLAPIGGGANVFVHDNQFEGPYSFEIDSALSGSGLELRSVTGFSADFAVDIADFDATPHFTYSTSVGMVEGTASFVDGVLTNLCFDAELALSYDFTILNGPVFKENGSISFRGNRFEMLVADPGYERDDPAEQIDGNGNGEGDDDDLVDPIIPTPSDTLTRDYAWDIFGEVENVTLSAPGDFDGDGSVTTLDYQLWVSQFGQNGGHADANHDCIVDAADYTVWRDAFAAGDSASSAAVPEPTNLLLVAAAYLATVWPRPTQRFKTVSAAVINTSPVIGS